MKRNTVVCFTIFGLLISGMQAWAAFSIDDLHLATRTACEEFQRIHADHVQHFTGYKSWFSGDDFKVKVYLTHDGMNMDYTYLCQKHDSSVHCLEQ